MLRTYAKLMHRVWLNSIALAILTAAVGDASARERESRVWVFLAATRGYDATLYKVSPQQQLTPIRQIVSLSEGTYLVEDTSANVLSVTPSSADAGPPTTIHVVRKDHPLQEDAVQINPQGRIPWSALDAVVLRDNAVWQLMTISAGQDLLPVVTMSAKLLPETEPRVTRVGADAYRNLDVYGIPGGTNFFGQTMNMRLIDKEFVLRVGDFQQRIMAAPSDLRQTDALFPIMAANPKYFVTLKAHTPQEAAKPIPGNMDDYVYRYATGTWTRVTVGGSASRQRIHGDWLSVIVQYWHPENTTNPGREAEREWKRSRPDLPPVQGGSEGAFSEIPGKLQLINLADGVRIEIDTRMEDSEVLTVVDNNILYRINDSIYEGQIKAGQVTNVTLLVKGEHVPEIHWAFLTSSEAIATRQ